MKHAVAVLAGLCELLLLILVVPTIVSVDGRIGSSFETPRSHLVEPSADDVPPAHDAGDTANETDAEEGEEVNSTEELTPDALAFDDEQASNLWYLVFTVPVVGFVLAFRRRAPDFPTQSMF